MVFFLRRGVWARALAAAFRPRGLVVLRPRALPAALAAFFPVWAGRPVWDKALAAAVLEARVDLELLRTFAAAVAARRCVCLELFLEVMSMSAFLFDHIATLSSNRQPRRSASQGWPRSPGCQRSLEWHDQLDAPMGGACAPSGFRPDPV